MNMREARRVELIETKSYEGAGVDGDPGRIVTTYWFPDGGCAAVFDPLREAGYDSELRGPVTHLGTVSEHGGGTVTILVKRDLENYPQLGEPVFMHTRGLLKEP